MGTWQAIGIGRASAFTCNQGLLGSREATSWGCLQFGMEMLPLKWEAKKRCMDLAANVG